MNRREFIKLSAFTAGAVLSDQVVPGYLRSSAAGDEGPAGHLYDMKVRSMDFEIIFDTEIINPPKHGEPVSIWMPLSQSGFEQDVTQLSVDAPVAFHINEEHHYGNKMVYTGPDRLKSGDKITVKSRIHRRTVSVIEDRNEDISRHLVLSEKEQWNDDIKAFADRTVGGERDPLETGRKIYYALHDLLTYDNDTIGCGPGVSKWTYENRGGRCADFHSLFRTMMIYRNIPVRWEQGILLPYPSEKTFSGELEGDCIGTLCWSKFYIGEGRWIPVDLVEGNQKKEMRDYYFGHLSPNRFNISTGRNLTLNPPQKAEALNTFPVTYGEYDGMPLIYGHHYRNNVRYKVLNVEM